MASKNEEEEKQEKKYDEVDFESAIEDFGEETVQFCVAAFLNKTYKELKANIPKLYKAQNYKEIRGKLHVLKTNSGYMGAANFSALCKEFETSCKFESLNEEKIDELYPIFMTNLDKLFLRLKKLNKEKFESPQEPEPLPDNQKEKESEQKKEDIKTNENKESKDNDNKINNADNIKKDNIENKEVNDNKAEQNKDNKENEEKKEKKETQENKEVKENTKDNQEQKEELNDKKMENINTYRVNNNDFKSKNINDEIKEENDEEESGNLLDSKLCPKESQKKVIFKNPLITSNKDVTFNNDIDINNKNNAINKAKIKHSLSARKVQKIRNLSSSNIHELTGLKQGNIVTFRGNPRYTKIFQSFKLTEEESKRKTENKASHSPKHTVETEKHKVLNRVKLGFSTMDKNEIRDCLKRYDIAVLKNSATLVKENLIKFLNDIFPTLLTEFNNYLNECDFSKKKEIIEKINIIISNMKYLSDNYNIYFFRVIERLEVCKDKEKFKLILTKFLQKLHSLEEELIIIYKVKIKRDDTFLNKMGYLQDFTKSSKKNVIIEKAYNHRNKENNKEQIEGLKKNLSVNNNGKIKELKTSRKKLNHFPYSFKDKLFSIEDKKQVHSSFKNSLMNSNNKIKTFKLIDKYLK